MIAQVPQKLLAKSCGYVILLFAERKALGFFPTLWSYNFARNACWAFLLTGGSGKNAKKLNFAKKRRIFRENFLLIKQEKSELLRSFVWTLLFCLPWCGGLSLPSAWGQPVDSEKPFSREVGQSNEDLAGGGVDELRPAETDPRADSVLEEEPEFKDPLESVNRGVLAFNTGLDVLLLNPLVEAYRFVSPPLVQSGVTNFVKNLSSPVIIINCLLQGEGGEAVRAVGRFLINTTLGLFGIFDVAGEMDLGEQVTDFGETLRLWGVAPGAYVVLPVLGPSTMRDVGGLLVDFAMNPLNIWLWDKKHEGLRFAYGGLVLFESKNQYFDLLEELRKTSLDYYGALRSLYRQKRAPENGSPETVS